jgi:hypothetical protein
MNRSNLFKVMNSILKMKYFRNEAACSGAVHNTANHEAAIAKILDEHGLKKYKPPKKLKKENAMKWLDNPKLASDIPNGTYIEQPFGKQSSPDLIVKENDIVFFIEAKSVDKNAKPLYNSGGINPKFIYVFCSKKFNETTIYRGCDIISESQYKLIQDHIAECRKRDEILNEELKKLDTTHRGVNYYTRPMIGQAGTKDYTNYFTHKQRQQVEQNTLEWIKNMCNNKVNSDGGDNEEDEFSDVEIEFDKYLGDDF